MMSVKQALLPYQQNLRNTGNLIRNHNDQLFQPHKSRDFYKKYKDVITKNVPITTNFLAGYCSTQDVRYVFTNKVVLEKEIKLKEFNFKLLHGILACNSNLKKWRLRNDDKCDVCQQIQTIEHLLFKCNYVKSIWKIVESVCNFKITFSMILGIEDCCRQDNVLTLISFLIYKEWLILSLDGKTRKILTNLGFYKEELLLRTKICEQCSNYLTADIDYISMIVQRIHDS